MNVENINLVADTIEDHAKRGEGLRGVGFNMSVYGFTVADCRPDHIDDCGTVACIAGWACLIALPGIANLEQFEEDTGEILEDFAADFLGLDWDKSGALFLPDEPAWPDITPMQAVRVLRHLAKTGEVDWSEDVRGPA